MTIAAQFQERLNSLSPRDERFAVDVVNTLLELAKSANASDIHILPGPQPGQGEVLCRIDGVLQPLGTLKHATVNVVSRLKVLANLLTYRTDIPQEGRLRSESDQVETRVSTFPTVYGEKAVVRLFVGGGHYRTLPELGFPDEVAIQLQRLLLQTSGLILICGPAGSGKTTTLYAAMRYIRDQAENPRSLCTLEDPVETLIEGVSQSHVRPEGEFSYQRGLASLMRQDPEVIMVGEIRDRQTAETVFQASLTGQLVLTSFHAGGAADAISRLADMGIEPYLLRSGLNAILAQRLLRRCCSCVTTSRDGCEQCRHTGYRGRMVIAELLRPDPTDLGRAILNRDDAPQIQKLAIESGMIPLLQRAQDAVAAGQTTQEEIIRVFGPQALA